MIQTQLLKADQPYQIICAAGQVGVQVATLIVTEDKITAEGYQIDTHSHPVVNYAVKDNLIEDLKYWNGDPEEEWKYTQRLQPEGAVWNKVEVRDVRVLGLVGAKNPLVDLEKFVSLVPSIPTEEPSVTSRIPLWGINTDRKIRNLKWALKRVGIGCCTFTNHVSNNVIREGQDWNDPGYIPINLEIDYYACVEKLVRVQIRKADYDYPPLPIDEIAFKCRLDKDPKNFIDTVDKCMAELNEQFIREENRIKFVYKQTSQKKDEWEELLEQATEQINKVWKNRASVF